MYFINLYKHIHRYRSAKRHMQLYMHKAAILMSWGWTKEMQGLVLWLLSLVFVFWWNLLVGEVRSRNVPPSWKKLTGTAQLRSLFGKEDAIIKRNIDHRDDITYRVTKGKFSSWISDSFLWLSRVTGFFLAKVSVGGFLIRSDEIYQADSNESLYPAGPWSCVAD